MNGITCKQIVKSETPRQRLLSQRLSSGQTMQQLYESWGFRFNTRGWLKPAKGTRP
jgi:hypothetical protein